MHDPGCVSVTCWKWKRCATRIICNPAQLERQAECRNVRTPAKFRSSALVPGSGWSLFDLSLVAEYPHRLNPVLGRRRSHRKSQMTRFFFLFLPRCTWTAKDWSYACWMALCPSTCCVLRAIGPL
jgi:hypothetical protein